MIKKTALLFLFYTALHADSRDQWETTEFIWNFGIISSCDVGAPKKPIPFFEAEVHQFNPKEYEKIKSGDIVWLKCRFVSKFYREILPKIKNPFVLVICDGDESFPSDCYEPEIEQFIINDNIIHIFAQNCDYQGNSKKVSHLPIGMDFHTIAYKGINGGWGEKGSPAEQEEVLNSILVTLLPTYQRKKRAFVDFQLSDSMHGEHNRYLQFGEDRASIFNHLYSTGLIDYAGWMRRSDLWRNKGEYAFSVSPHGNGLDCHRTWEDLVLGCIVIVKSSPLDPMYEGLPVVIVKEWSEVNEDNLTLWLERFSDAFTNASYRKKLKHQYWMKKILKKAIPYRIH